MEDHSWRPTPLLRLKPEWEDDMRVGIHEHEAGPLFPSLRVPVQRKWVRTWVEVEWRDEP